MADPKTIPPAASRMLNRMSDIAQKLPPEWDEGTYCMDLAIELAKLVDQLDWRICHDNRDTLLRVGATLLRSVYHQVEAGHLADAYMDELRRGRG